jgi:hypothetical protein
LPGTLINKNGTIELVGTNGTIGVPSMDVLNSWGYSLVNVVNANTADKALPQSNILASHVPGQLAYNTTANNPAAPTQTPTSTTPTPAPSPTATTDYSQYQNVDFDVYKSNPNQYVGSDIAVLGMLDNVFLPSNGSNGNYIETIDPADTAQPKIEIEIGNQSDYTAAVNGLQPNASQGEFIKTYGVGTQSQQFILTNGQSTSLPVIKAQRIDICHGTFQTTVLTGSTLSDMLSCTSWTTVIPSAQAGTVYTTPTPTPITSPTPTPVTTQTPSTQPSTTPATLNIPTLDSSSPVAQSVTSQSTNQLAAVFHFVASGGSVNISELDFTANSTVAGAITAVTVGGVTFPAYNNSIIATGINIPVPASSGGMNVPVMVNYSCIGLNCVSATPVSVQLVLSRVKYISGNSAESLPASGTGSLNVASNSFTIVSSSSGNTTPTPTPTPLPTLKSLTVNGTTVMGFSPNTYNYNVTLPAGSPQAPTVAAVVNDPTATDVITQAADSLGTATVVVTAQNGTTQNTYTITFRPSDAGQCNFNGNIFYCASDSGITVSPTSLPSATVGSSYSEPVSISDPGTSSQNFRWNIISGLFPPGLGFAFSPSGAIECSGTYCFFTTPPSGVSVPSNSPGIFFGTPTAAGTYSFTFQAIDSLDYTALPTFTITIASSTPGQ